MKDLTVKELEQLLAQAAKDSLAAAELNRQNIERMMAFVGIDVPVKGRIIDVKHFTRKAVNF